MPPPAPNAFRRSSRWHHSCSCVVVDADGRVRGAVDSIEDRVATHEGRTLEQSRRIDDGREAPQEKLTFVTDTEKAALSGVSADQIASTLQAILGGATVGLVRNDTERNPLRIQRWRSPSPVLRLSFA